MDATNTAGDRRRAFVRHLYGLYHALDSDNPQRASEARRQLARLRRSFAGRHHEVEAYDVVFPFDPPSKEQDLWLLVAGLFALHPQGHTAGRSLGRAMRLLSEERSSAKRRFTQLLSVDQAALPHYLRQAVQLLRAGNVALDYQMLLNDLVRMRTSRDEAHRVRLRWARDFHQPEPRTADDRNTAQPQEPVASTETADA